MLILKRLSVAISISMIASAAVAHRANMDLINTKAVDKDHLWVVSPGTRLVAGDSKQADFFILDAKTNATSSKVKMASKRVHRKISG